MQMCLEPEVTESEDEVIGTEAYEELFAQTPDVNYECVKTIISEALFNPPASVEFTDLQQMMESLTGQWTSLLKEDSAATAAGFSWW